MADVSMKDVQEVQTSKNSKIFFHIDVNSAFLSWEAASRIQRGEEIDLREIPSAVGGDIESRRGIILAKSIPAKKYGIITGEPLTDALKKCPHLTVVPGNFDLYVKSSRALFEVIRKYSEHITVYSIDECFVDVSDLRWMYRDPVELAHLLREEIKKELGFTVSIGVSSNRLLAKMASDLKKPDAVSTMYPHEMKSKMWPLPIRDLFMVGRKTAQKLAKIGIHTIGDLAKSNLELISNYLQATGRTAWKYANGIADVDLAAPADMVKSIGNSTTVRFDVSEMSEALLILLSLTEKVMGRLREIDRYAKTVCITYKSAEFEVFEHQGTFVSPTSNTMEVFEKASELFRELWDGRPIRAIGLRVCNLRKADGLQLTFFDPYQNQKTSGFDEAVDQIRKHGHLVRAGLIGSGLEDIVTEREEELEDFLFH